MSARSNEGCNVEMTVMLLARSALNAAPVREMARLRDQVAALPGVSRAAFAFSEQGSPSVREVIDELVAGGCRRLLIIPFLMPAEPNLNAWLTKTLQRWHEGDLRAWPDVQLAPLVADHPGVIAVLGNMIQRGGAPIEITQTRVAESQGSIVPLCKRTVLVCMGGPCNVAGAGIVWGHLRRENDRLSLRTSGAGTFTAKTSCLGPCALAPVVQVWPEGIHYGGVSEAGIDRIIEHHILNGTVVEDLSYRPTGRKQFLRS